MRTKVAILSSLFFYFLAITESQAQYEGTEYGDTLYFREYLGGVVVSEYGGTIGGLYLKHARAITPKMYHAFLFEVLFIKEPRERTTRLDLGGRTISYSRYKKNYLTSIRLLYGRDLILFKKARDRGLQVNFHGLAGLVLGLESSYDFEIRRKNSSRTERISGEEFWDPNRDSLGVIGRVNPVRAVFGVDRVRPGISIRPSFMFEYGLDRRKVTGLEIGVSYDYYFSAPEILINGPLNENGNYRKSFISIFAAFNLGVRK